MTKTYLNPARTVDVAPDVIHTTNLMARLITCHSSCYSGNTRITNRKEQRRWTRSHLPRMFYSSLQFFILLISVHIVSCQNTLTPTITSSTTYLEEQKPASIICSVSSSATPTTSDSPLSWFRTGGLPTSATTNSSQQPGSGGSTTYQSTLTFQPTALDNAVNIFCSATIGNLSGTTSYTPQVILDPDEPVITGPDAVNANENATWTCQVNGASQVAPNVYWRNGRGEALTSNVTKATNIRQVPNQNRVYEVTQTISILLPPTAAQYNLSCIVVHVLAHYSSIKTATKTITVYFPPQITKNGGDLIYTNEGQSPTLSCIILVSNPAATDVSWTKDGQPVNASSGRYGPVNTNSSSLTILSALRSDRGDYVCTVSNSEGSTSFTTPTTLIVRYPPAVNSTGNETVVGIVGGRMTIPCPVDAEPLPTAIIWKRILNGQVETINITNNSRYSGGTVVNQQYDLLINPVQADDAGTYFCEAVNDVGTGTGDNITTVVRYEPVVNVPPYLEVIEGFNFTISCQIIMYPAVRSVAWFKGNTQLTIPGSLGRYSGGTVQSPSLSVLSAVKADSGTYRCQGSNGTTTISGTIVVSVTYAPKVSVPSSDVIGNLGGRVTISCTIDAVPPATSIVWLLHDIDGSNNSAVVVPTGGRYSGGNLTTPSLTIYDLVIGDTATYYCQVSNSIGQTTSNPVNIRVQYKPIVQVTSDPSVLRTGEQFQLTCSANAYPPITSTVWYQGNVRVSNTQNYTKLQASVSDYTDFRCVVTNRVGSSSASIRPNIQFSPQLSGSGKVTIKAKRYTTISLVCLVTANPEPVSYAWYKEGIIIPEAVQKNLSVQVSNDTDFGEYKCSVNNFIGELDPAREFTVIEDKGSSDDSGLSTPIIIMIVFLILLFLIILILLIVCCCLYGVCAKKRNKSKVDPGVAANGTNYNDEEYEEADVLRSPLPSIKPKSNGDIGGDIRGIDDINGDNPIAFLTPGNKLSPINNRGSIISVPEKTGARAYHLPPLDPEGETTGENLREEEKRRSRKKKQKKHKEEDRSALTGSEERSSGSSPTNL